MPVVVVGANHRSAPVDLLERLAVLEDRLPKALDGLAQLDEVLEGVVLSTCNRTEVYATVTRYHAGIQNLRDFLCEFCHVAPEELADHLYAYHDDGAVRHLLRVAAGIDSLVVGESEILGQVRSAFAAATDKGLCRHLLATAFKRALRAGKRARTETAIGRNPASVSTAAVELARRAFGSRDLSGRRVLVVGTGNMGRLAAAALRDRGATELTVMNRTYEGARALGRQIGAAARPLADLVDALAEADIVISSTAAPGHIILRSHAEEAMRRRGPNGTLVVVDIAVPRDVATSVGEVDGAVLHDIGDLKDVVEASMGTRRAEVTKVEAIVAEELEAYLAWERAIEVAPTAAALVEFGERVRAHELQRIATVLAEMPERQRSAVEDLSRRLVSKLLHPPLARTKEASASQQGQLYVKTVRELFGLQDDDSA